ncbi:MAG: hypothetical protein ABIP21_03195, partial [Acidimicrobiia bacterium]
RVGSPYRVEASIANIESDRIEATATMTDQGGRTRARAEATFVPLGAAQAVDAIGGVSAGADTEYFRA